MNNKERKQIKTAVESYFLNAVLELNKDIGPIGCVVQTVGFSMTVDGNKHTGVVDVRIADEESE